MKYVRCRHCDSAIDIHSVGIRKLIEFKKKTSIHYKCLICEKNISSNLFEEKMNYNPNIWRDI